MKLIEQFFKKNYVSDTRLQRLTCTPRISSREGSNSTRSHGDIKNLLRQTAANESTTATLTYDAFGNAVSSSGTWQGRFQYEGNFGYQTDTDSGLKLLGHRYYDASTGRFVTRDPIKDGRNWYTYAGNNPISNADPDGRKLQVVHKQPPRRYHLAGSEGFNAGYRARFWAATGRSQYMKRWSGHGNRGVPLNTDCAWFVAQCYKGIVPNFPKENTGYIYEYLHDPGRNQGYFVQVPNDENYVPQSGDIWIWRGDGEGHIIIVGDDGKPYDASLGDHGPQLREEPDQDRPGSRRPQRRPGDGYEIWRPT